MCRGKKKSLVKSVCNPDDKLEEELSDHIIWNIYPLHNWLGFVLSPGETPMKETQSLSFPSVPSDGGYRQGKGHLAHQGLT
jgi:hypothetical protein